jgi:hypothetical protein
VGFTPRICLNCSICKEGDGFEVSKHTRKTAPSREQQEGVDIYGIFRQVVIVSSSPPGIGMFVDRLYDVFL